MNRQVRRIEEKKERKQEKEKAKAKAARRARRRERLAQRRKPSADERGGDTSGAEGGAPERGTAGRRRGSDPGRFSGALMVATLFFMVLQAVAPTEDAVTTQVVAASFYLLFGYFAVLFLMRRGSERAVPIALGVGVAIGVGTALSQWLQPTLELAPLMLALIVPLLAAGAFLGRLVYRNAPG